MRIRFYTGQKEHRKRPVRPAAFAIGASALAAFIVTLLVFLSVKGHKSREVITYVKNFHPKKLQTVSHDDVFISVKTTHKNHQSRLDTVISTWYQLARENTYFFTDKDDLNISSAETSFIARCATKFQITVMPCQSVVLVSQRRKDVSRARAPTPHLGPRNRDE